MVESRLCLLTLLLPKTMVTLWLFCRNQLTVSDKLLIPDCLFLITASPLEILVTTTTTVTCDNAAVIPAPRAPAPGRSAEGPLPRRKLKGTPGIPLKDSIGLDPHPKTLHDQRSKTTTIGPTSLDART